jgi:integrase
MKGCRVMTDDEVRMVLNELQVRDRVLFFISQKGKNQHITRQLASSLVKKTVKTLGLEGKINTHSFRKSFVTKIYEMTGYNIAETKTYSRHKSLVNLEYYIKTTESTDLVEQLNWC